MLLEPLISVIETLKKRIAVHGASLRENETRTRMALIDPLLQALGWDIADPAMVLPEYSVSKGRVDYALLAPSGKPSTVLEAKRLTEGLENHSTQMVAYALEDGVAYAGLTDGDRWHIYDVFKPVPLSDKRILDISISSTSAHETALKLLLLWRPNLASGLPVAASEPILSARLEPASTQAFQSVDTPSTPSQTRPSTPSLQTPISVEAGWNSLVDVTYQPGDKKPTGIRFSGADLKDIKSRADVWFEVCEWLTRDEKLTAANCPVPSSRGKGVRELVNTTGQHPPSSKNPNGNEFAQSRKTSTGLFVETNYAPKDLIGNAKFLLDRLSIPVETVELRFA